MPSGYASMEAKKTGKKSFFELALVPNGPPVLGDPHWNSQEAPVIDKKTARYQREPHSRFVRILDYGKAADYKEWL